MKLHKNKWLNNEIDFEILFVSDLGIGKSRRANTRVEKMYHFEEYGVIKFFVPNSHATSGTSRTFSYMFPKSAPLVTYMFPVISPCMNPVFFPAMFIVVHHMFPSYFLVRIARLYVSVSSYDPAYISTCSPHVPP